MRIIGGVFRGRTLNEFMGREIRPTSDSARESLFNILGDVSGRAFLDLFAGTGAVGIEALSRGANAYFNDANKNSVDLIKSNLHRLSANAEVSFSDALGYIKNTSRKFDVIFCDPPYKSDVIGEVMNALSAILTDGGVAVLENETPFVGTADGLYMYDVRRYGRAVFSFFKKREDGCAFYAGTFDPITKGHERSVLKAIDAFGKAVIILGDNPNKTPFFSREERFSMLKATFKDKNAEIVDYRDFPSVEKYSEFLKSRNARYFVRGIRNEDDFAYEKKAEKRNFGEYPDFTTAYIFCEEEYKKYSSTKVRTALKKGNSAEEFIPENAVGVFREIITKEKQK